MIFKQIISDNRCKVKCQSFFKDKASRFGICIWIAYKMLFETFFPRWSQCHTLATSDFHR